MPVTYFELCWNFLGYNENECQLKLYPVPVESFEFFCKFSRTQFGNLSDAGMRDTMSNKCLLHSPLTPSGPAVCMSTSLSICPRCLPPPDWPPPEITSPSNIDRKKTVGRQKLSLLERVFLDFFSSRGRKSLSFGFTLRPQTPKHIRGGWSHYTDTREPVDGAQNIVTVQSGFRTRDLLITGPTRLQPAPAGPKGIEERTLRQKQGRPLFWCWGIRSTHSDSTSGLGWYWLQFYLEDLERN
jgi:hypothetical protein